MKNIEIKRLLKADASSIVSLIEAGLREDIFPLTIYSSSNYEQYVRDQIEHSHEVAFYAAYQDEQVIGFAEWRNVENEIFLNNIFMDPSKRGLGIGKELLQHGLQVSNPRAN